MQNAWHEGTMMGFDLETTGKDPTTARIVTASLVTINLETGTRESRQWLAYPEIPISEEASSVHGVTQKQAEEEGQDPDTVSAEVIDAINEAQAHGIPVVSHNSQYDFTILDRDSQRYGLPKVRTDLCIDTLVLDRHCEPDVPGQKRRSRQLSHLAYYYDQEWDGNAHTSNADSIMAVKIAYQLASWYPDELQVPFDELRKNQEIWSNEWVEALRDRFSSYGYDISNIKNGWPAIPGEPGVDQVDVMELPSNALISPDGSKIAETSLVAATPCGYPTEDGSPCTRPTRPGTYCYQHS